MTYSQRPNHAARMAHARGAKEFKTYDTSYIRPAGPKIPKQLGVVIAVVAVVAIFLACALVIRGCTNSSGDSGVQLNGSDQTATITVNAGDGGLAIGQYLQDAGLVSSASEFSKRVEKLGAGNDLKPGTYTIAGGTSLDDIIATLQAGPATGPTVTVPEGYKLADIADAVASASSGRISAEDFTAAASDASVYAADYAFLEGAGSNSLEGFLFPKTYEIADDATADSLVRQMLDQFNTEYATLDFSYPENQGLSIYDAVTLASIVEKESTGSDDIRAQVAGVFYNRLMNAEGETAGYLQSDATTAYVVGHDPTADEVHADDAYSTYTNQGLPPTPICSPGLACLKAVCSPVESSNYYFYFWDGDDGTLEYAFTETYDEHQAAIANNG